MLRQFWEDSKVIASFQGSWWVHFAIQKWLSLPPAAFVDQKHQCHCAPGLRSLAAAATICHHVFRIINALAICIQYHPIMSKRHSITYVEFLDSHSYAHWKHICWRWVLSPPAAGSCHGASERRRRARSITGIHTRCMWLNGCDVYPWVSNNCGEYWWTYETVQFGQMCGSGWCIDSTELFLWGFVSQIKIVFILVKYVWSRPWGKQEFHSSSLR